MKFGSFSFSFSGVINMKGCKNQDTDEMYLNKFSISGWFNPSSSKWDLSFWFDSTFCRFHFFTSSIHPLRLNQIPHPSPIRELTQLSPGLINSTFHSPATVRGTPCKGAWRGGKLRCKSSKEIFHNPNAPWVKIKPKKSFPPQLPWKSTFPSPAVLP